ncbi:MAG: molybdopterin molybdotransferase MoeA [Micavibrio aeruginosavorus]|uniref:Molybdopterin molybdenumtransferase n=1 Tax=Micavibrio aeruginosavorus TaxID=349221 RepID=A0A7T5R4A7_9BACT|nr:MAG: molybdopterin molybdotransferase MoeA [Micavibrio aeruginosavorus]
MISYSEALRIILQQGSRYCLGYEKIDVAAIAGRICAAEIRARVDNQPFDNSAMDGFAVKVTDFEQASEFKPVSLSVAGHIAAGELRRFPALSSGQCYEIMTGAPVPPGCDAVVPVEKTMRDDAGRVVFSGGAVAGENIRYAGSDFHQGDVLVRKSEILHPGHILALATAGVGCLDVVCKARVALISTGQEVIESFDTPLRYGQIYNSTKPYLKGAVAALGMDVAAGDTVQDDPAAFQKKLESLCGAGIDIFISTGAVSAGVHDFVPSVLKDMGFEIFFHKAAIRPGKPVLFAMLSPGGPFYFGLPGNPAATAAGLRFFVYPLLRALQGLPPPAPQYGIMQGSFRKGDMPLRFFMQARTFIDQQGRCRIEIPQKQPSFMVSPFIGSNAWAVVPEDVGELKDGDLVEFYQ